MFNNTWIHSVKVDSVFILFPPFLTLLIVFLIPDSFQNTDDIPLIVWVIVVMFIDVAHVYASLYRTYFDREALNENRSKFIAIPAICFCLAVLTYSFGYQIFWRSMAYLAVFHFIRQQYGFMRIYGRNDQQPLSIQIDRLTIYTSTLYPMLHWHLSGPNHFHWFVEGDFFYFKSQEMSAMALIVYLLVLVVYLIKEAILFLNQTFNLPKFLLISGTVASWYFGIVYFKGDLTFTLLNVVSHGIPYMTLVWAWGYKKNNKKGFEFNPFMKTVFSNKGLWLFLGVLFLLAYLEEAFWDVWVWKEKNEIFGLFQALKFNMDHTALNLIVPLLSLPQIVHYVIDGYIWKLKSNNSKWSDDLLTTDSIENENTRHGK